MTMLIREWDGGRITRPGIYSGIPIETYHRGHDVLFGGEPNISSTGLRTIDSPESSLAHFHMTYPGNPDCEAPEPKKHFDIGHARHTLYLGEPGFREKFVIRPETYPERDKKGEFTGNQKPWNSNSDWCSDWLAEAKKLGKAVITVDDFEDIKRAAMKLAAHPTIKAGILNGLIEKSIFWTRDVVLDDGRVVTVWLKSRPDVLPLDSLMIVDYKTTADASPNSVRRSITDFGYHQQLALGHEGIYVTTGRAMEEHVLVFQEVKKPYAINVKPLMGSAIHAGHMQNWRALRKFAQAVADDVWPGYEDDEVPCDLMDWRQKQLKLELEAGLLVEPPELKPQFGETPIDAEFEELEADEVIEVI